MIDPALSRQLALEGYVVLREINGVLCGVNKFMFTHGLTTHVDRYGYDDRWCFQHREYAVIALAMWDGQGDPPGPWIKQKGRVERHNPKLYTHRGGAFYERNDTPAADTWPMTWPMMPNILEIKLRLTEAREGECQLLG